MKAKTPEQSKATLTNIVLPSETNIYDNLFGGELLARMDRIASIAARKHSGRETITASVNHVTFDKPIPVGSIVRLEAKVSRAFKTSMEVFVDVWIDYVNGETSLKTNEGIYTFVAINQGNTPVTVPELKPETDIEKQRFQDALRRKELSLIMSGRLNPREATELKKMFE